MGPDEEAHVKMLLLAAKSSSSSTVDPDKTSDTEVEADTAGGCVCKLIKGRCGIPSTSGELGKSIVLHALVVMLSGSGTAGIGKA